MAKRKTKWKKKKVRPRVQTKYILKTLKGKKTKFVSVTIRKGKKAVNKQYKYRGGRLSTYLEEARLPKGTKYYVNYKENRIITDTEQVMSLVKTVKDRKKITKKGKKRKPISTKKALKQLRIIPKKTYSPPKPVDADKVVDLLRKNVDFEREYSIKEFSTKQGQDKFLMALLMKGTGNKKDALKLLHNFEKVKRKISYAVVIEGTNIETKQSEQIATFTAIEKKPLEIVSFLREVNLLPSNVQINIYDDVVKPFKNRLDSQGVYFNRHNGTYIITDVRVAVKFYNDVQTRLK